MDNILELHQVCKTFPKNKFLLWIMYLFPFLMVPLWDLLVKMELEKLQQLAVY